jgi:succinyl-diaminopimelate desuccinylase
MNDIAKKVIYLAQKLISIPSVTPNDEGCQKIIFNSLKPLGFTAKYLRYGDVDNLWAKRGTSGPIFVFAGHTDVVPPGPLDLWTSPPFKPEVREGNLYGRGAADMKSSLAAMVVATEKFTQQYPNHQGSIGFIITSDEEGQAKEGTAKVVEYLQQQKEKIDYCLVGEASSEKQLGDVIKIGRRGSLNGKLLVHGKQGHVAYPQLADNPIHKAVAAIAELCSAHWDNGNKQFPPTSFQITNFHSGTGADNVIPNSLEIIFNFRYSPEVTKDQLQQKVNTILQHHQIRYEIEWRHSAKPFLTSPGELATATTQAIQDIMQIKPQLTTTGGTSDGRFIAMMGCQVVELGPINKSIHQINEHINLSDLSKLTQIYYRILEKLLID